MKPNIRFQKEILGNMSDIKNFKNINKLIIANFLENTKKQDYFETRNNGEIINKLKTRGETIKSSLKTIYNIINEYILDLKTQLEIDTNKSGKHEINLKENIRTMSLNKQKINQMITEIEISIEIINNDKDIINNSQELKRIENIREYFLQIAKSYLP